MRHVCTRVQSLKVSLRAPAKAWRSCHALSGGQVKCWGANTGGKLGTGNTASYGDSAGEMGANLPAVDLGTGRTAVAISLGQDHTCALLDNGSMKCWGDNSQGQLGYGDTTSRGSNSAHMGDNLAAIDLGDGRTATAIATGQYHTCAILDDWSTKCWGYNDNGQLGLGHTNNIGDGAAEMGNSLAAVNLGTGRFAKKISAGAGITCVVLLDDTALCWGKNNGGQLGQDSTTNMGSTSGNSVDSMSTINLGSGRTAKIVAPGEFHVCALLDDDTVKCWGSSSYGQLGQGDTSSWGTSSGSNGMANLPAVELGQSASALATSTHHNCVRLADDSLRCWGYNGSGELGLGDTANRGDGSGEMGTSLPAVSLGTGRTVTSAAPSRYHTCALLDDETVKCWGYGNDGRLGQGSTDHIRTAAEMGDNLAVVELFPTTTTSTFSTSTTTTRSASTTSTTSTGTSSTATTITTSTSASTSATSTASTSTSTTSTTGTRTSVTGTSTSTSATGTTSTSASTSTSSSSTSSSTSTTTTTSGTSSATVTSSRTSATHTRSTTTSTSSTGSTSSITTTISSTRSTTASSSSTSSSSSSSFSSSSTSASTSWTSSSSRTSSTSTTASSTSTTTNTRTSATGSTSTTSSTSSTSSSSATFTSTTTISSTVTRSSTTRTFQGAAEVAAYMEQQRVEAVNSAVSSAEAAAQAVVDASAKQLLQQLDVGEPMMQLEQQTPDGAVTGSD
ncbi:unnamed protein product [Effrenium voratum]|nr:unnamed protein product [Effrenium voratum]